MLSNENRAEISARHYEYAYIAQTIFIVIPSNIISISRLALADSALRSALYILVRSYFSWCSTISSQSAFVHLCTGLKLLP